MTQHYIFNESGCIPGIPGTFAGIRVDIDGQGVLHETPLENHPHFLASNEVHVQAVQEAPELHGETSQEQSQPVQETPQEVPVQEEHQVEPEPVQDPPVSGV